MKTDTALPLSNAPNHPPLAHDIQGFKLSVPDGTTHWRILRHTRGRPKPVPGPDMQPARFALDMTQEDLLDLCGPGTYRVEALDEYGNRLACITTVTIGGEAMPMPAESPLAARAGTNDLRIAMETIAQMSRSHSESLQSLANAQADWIKMLATAKAIPRNGFAPAASAQAVVTSDNESEPRPGWVKALEPAMPMLVTAIVRNLGSWLGGKPAAPPRFRNASQLSLIGHRQEETAPKNVLPTKLPTFDEQLAAVCAVLTPEELDNVTTGMKRIQPICEDTFIRMTSAQAVEFVRKLFARAATAAAEQAS